MWMLFLFNPPHGSGLLNYSSSVLTDGCSFHLPHVQVFAEACGAGGEIVSILAGFLSGLLAGSCALDGSRLKALRF